MGWKSLWFFFKFQILAIVRIYGDDDAAPRHFEYEMTMMMTPDVIKKNDGVMTI